MDIYYNETILISVHNCHIIGALQLAIISIIYFMSKITTTMWTNEWETCELHQNALKLKKRLVITSRCGWHGYHDKFSGWLTIYSYMSRTNRLRGIDVAPYNMIAWICAGNYIARDSAPPYQPEIRGLIDDKMNNLTFWGVCRFIVNMVYCGKLFLPHLNTQISVIADSRLRAPLPLASSIIWRRFLLFRDTTWLNNG